MDVKCYDVELQKQKEKLKQLTRISEVTNEDSSAHTTTTPDGFISSRTASKGQVIKNPTVQNQTKSGRSTESEKRKLSSDTDTPLFGHHASEIGTADLDLNINYVEEAKQIAISIFCEYIAHDGRFHIDLDPKIRCELFIKFGCNFIKTSYTETNPPKESDPEFDSDLYNSSMIDETIL